MTIRVLVAEDHHLVRQGIVKLLEGEGDLEVVGEADNGREALTLIDSSRPDVVILDISMPQFDGLETLSELNRRAARPKVVILSMHADPGLVRQVLRAGALGYIVKQSVADELLAAVRAAKNGSMYLSSAISGLIASDLFAEHPPNRLDRLSPRERQVVQLIVEGHATREIAESLHTSVKTVEKQRRDAMRKLEVDNLASLVRISLELGLDVGRATRS